VEAILYLALLLQMVVEKVELVIVILFLQEQMVALVEVEDN
jgi:hypothetical protein